jgi:hypothetical protein
VIEKMSGGLDTVGIKGEVTISNRQPAGGRTEPVKPGIKTAVGWGAHDPAQGTPAVAVAKDWCQKPKFDRLAFLP